MASLNDIETKVQSIIDMLYSRIVKTITGILPLTFTANAGNAVDWSISGNDNVGENLFGSQIINGRVDTTNGSIITSPTRICNQNKITVNTGGTYTVSASGMDDVMIFTYTTTGEYIDDERDTEWHALPYSRTIQAHRQLIVQFRKTDGANIYPSDVTDVMVVKGSTAPDHFIPYQQGVGEQRVDGYYVPLTISQTGQTAKNYDIYIGDTPLTAGQSISKTSTGVDLELFEGENTVSTTLYNKPEMTIKYKYNGGN